MISVIAIGKKHESWIERGVERYEKRLSGAWSTKWVLLPHSTREADSARQEESERILARISPEKYVILLDERGTAIDSPALSARIDQCFVTARPIVLVIGGAYGVSDALRQRADFVWSLSPLVFPHQLVRLILIEQLYRAQEIARGHPYHHQ